MTVKEIFELRKQGRIEEAYDAIRPMYAVHKGHYTTLCMFWTASDILKKRVEEKRFDEAKKIFEALLRMLPMVDDRDRKAHSAIVHHAVLLGRECPSFSVLDFLRHFGPQQLGDADWQTVTVGGPSGSDAAGRRAQPGAGSHPVPSAAHQLLTRAFHELQGQPTPDRALLAMPLLQEAVRRTPEGKNCQRYMAVVYTIMGERQKAADLYGRLLARHHDSYLYAELAELTEDAGRKAALYCRAIENQRQEKFRTGYRLALARLLLGRDNARAAYELQRIVATRQALGHGITRELQTLQAQLASAQPVTDASQRDFYRRMAAKYQV